MRVNRRNAVAAALGLSVTTLLDTPPRLTSLKRYWPALTLIWFGMPGIALAEPSPLRKCDPEQFAVAVDVGHSSQDPGALSARGLPEYEYNLRLAQRIGKKLSNAGYRKTMVRMRIPIDPAGHSDLKPVTVRT